jgi:hypothetical protein
MSRRRILIAVAAGLSLLVLLAWQFHRETQMGRCVASGGQWDGANSRCVHHPSGITIQRDLYRS